jgi:hypothetical protein
VIIQYRYWRCPFRRSGLPDARCMVVIDSGDPAVDDGVWCWQRLAVVAVHQCLGDDSLRSGDYPTAVVNDTYMVQTDGR